jgi:hypothetical protein
MTRPPWGGALAGGVPVGELLRIWRDKLPNAGVESATPRDGAGVYSEHSVGCLEGLFVQALQLKAVYLNGSFR